MKTHSIRICGALTAALIVLATAPLQSHAQAVSNFVDEFTTFDTNTWSLVNPGGGASFDGIVGDGYQISYPANGIPDSGLVISLDGTTNDPPGQVTNSFTVDVSVDISAPGTGFTGELKFRFFGGQFIEFFVDIDANTIRVFSAEVGGNIVDTVPAGLTSGSGRLNLRLSRDVDTGTIVTGFSSGTNDLEVLGSVSGLLNFTPQTCDIVMARGNQFFGADPTLVIDRYEQRDGVFGIGIDPFTETFDGPSLDPSWNVVGDEQVGFIGGGLYEVKKTNTVGEAGLTRAYGGQSTFNSSFKFQVDDFNGSASEVEYRASQGGSDAITVTLNSDNDIVVATNGTTVTELTDFLFQDGETLEIVVTADALDGATQVGLSRNNGQLLRLADLTGLSPIPDTDELVVIKNAAGNGNSPRLLFDEYSVSEGLIDVPAAAFTDEFTGPTLDPGWLISDTGVGSFVGFNGSGQYEVSPQATNVTASLRRFLGIAGDATITMRGCLNDFIGSDSELRLQIPGSDGVSVVLESDGTLEVVTASPATTVVSTNIGLTDGDLFDIVLSIQEVTGAGTNGFYEVGFGLNGAQPGFIASDGCGNCINVGLPNLETVQAEVVLTKNGVGDGSTASLLLDQFKVNEGFTFIPEELVPYSDDFSNDLGGWTAVGLTHIGYTNSGGTNGLYVVQVTTNAQVYYARDISTTITPSLTLPVGSFVLELDAQFTGWAQANTNQTGAGGGADFKLWVQSVDGGRLMETVFNSFKGVRFSAQGNGGNFLVDTLSDFENGDTVNFRIIYDASAPSVTMSIGLNGGPAVFTETQSGLVGVGPITIRFQGFRFNFANLDLSPAFALDQLDITTGLAGVPPGPLSIDDGYGGRVQLEWGLGTLQSAPALDGPYNDVGVKATSPYLQLPAAGEEYFRTRN